MKIILKIIYLITLIILPFILFVRLSVYCYGNYNLNGWAAIMAATVMTTFLMFIYFSFMYAKFTGKLGDWMGLKRRAYAAGFLVFAFAAYSLFYISGKHTKADQVQSEYLDLHPILRISVSTLILVDNTLLITDGSRLPEDYKKMGLKSKASSLHYKQSTGYSHALDIRTKSRSDKWNYFVEHYFKLMGFNTLRHIGTADHLHVSLAPPDKPYAK